MFNTFSNTVSSTVSSTVATPEIQTAFQDQLHLFQPIHLEEMGAVQLQNRVDTKFVMTQRQLLQALRSIGAEYQVLDVDGVRLNRYRSLYFDTANFDFYRQHHNGQMTRYKVRFREYVESNLSFVEVKAKTNTRRTIKYRQRVRGVANRLDPEAQHFIQPNLPIDVHQLQPRLWNSFLRITLVSNQQIERLTLDLDLHFRRDHMDLWLAPIAIAEVKQEKFSLQSHFMQQMRQMGIQPSSFSKYCIGTARLYPYLKKNRFKETFLRLEKLQRTDTISTGDNG